MSFCDEAIQFACSGETLFGMITRPKQATDCGVLILVGGPQYRIGSHRQFVLLSRRLAAEGFVAMRFDCRGMGDSTGEARSFESIDDDIAAAVDTLLRACPELTRIVLWGLCDAASAALLYLERRRDPRVAGLVLLNPWVRSELTLAQTQIRHYYGRRLLERDFWRKLAAGDVRLGQSAQSFLKSALRVLGGRAETRAARPFQARMADGLAGFAGKVTLVLSGQDYTAKEFIAYATGDAAWKDLLGRTNVERIDLPAADHTFSRAAWRHEVEQLTLNALREITEPACVTS